MAELVREIMIDATPETIFPFLTDAERHVEWDGTEAELDPRPGGIYRVLVAGEHQAAGEFVEVVPNEKVVFTFGWEQEGNPITPGSTRVEITLHAEGAKTRLRLVHSGLPEDAVADHTQGWDHYLGRLAIVAAGGTVPADVPGRGRLGRSAKRYRTCRRRRCPAGTFGCSKSPSGSRAMPSFCMTRSELAFVVVVKDTISGTPSRADPR